MVRRSLELPGGAGRGGRGPRGVAGGGRPGEVGDVFVVELRFLVDSLSQAAQAGAQDDAGPGSAVPVLTNLGDGLFNLVYNYSIRN